MGNAWKCMVVFLGVWAVAQTLVLTPAEAQLSPFFYLTSCPLLLPVVGLGVKQAMQSQSRVAATLLRLHFHDCFVLGCDGSVLLDDTTGIQTEKLAPPNNNSLTPFVFETIDTIKASVESICPNVVSCADIVALAALFSVVLSGGPYWSEPLGRRDAFLPATEAVVLASLISPDATLTTNKARFANQNLTVEDMVTLSGAHTIGLATCAAIQHRLYNFSNTETSPSAPQTSDPSINATLLASLKKTCPDLSRDKGNTTVDGAVTNPMDPPSPTVFDNSYYQNLLIRNGLFTTDEDLYVVGNDTKPLVVQYAEDQDAFFSAFSDSMIKMGNLRPLTGTEGEIRQNCRVPNAATSIVDDDERIKLGSLAVEQIEGGSQDLDQFMANVMTQILRYELEQLVEETASEKYADM